MLPHFSLFDFSGDPLGLGEGVGVAGLGDTVGAAGVAAGAVAGVAGLVWLVSGSEAQAADARAIASTIKVFLNMDSHSSDSFV